MRIIGTNISVNSGSSRRRRRWTIAPIFLASYSSHVAADQGSPAAAAAGSATTPRRRRSAGAPSPTRRGEGRVVQDLAQRRLHLAGVARSGMTLKMRPIVSSQLVEARMAGSSVCARSDRRRRDPGSAPTLHACSRERPSPAPPTVCACAGCRSGAPTTERRSTASSTRRSSPTSGSSRTASRFVIPTLHARVGDRVYVHGSAASRTLRVLSAGIPACLTVTLLDGIVLARSVFEHSMNYRSVVVLGHGDAGGRAPTRSSPRSRRSPRSSFPGAGREARQPTAKELQGDLGAPPAARRGVGEDPRRRARGRRHARRRARRLGRAPAPRRHGARARS